MFRKRKKELSIKNSTKGYFEEINLKKDARYVCRANKVRVKEDEVTPPKKESSTLCLSRDARN